MSQRFQTLLMDSFQKAAESLIEISIKALELIKTKHEYAKSINYQINQLFLQLGESSQQEEAHLLDTANLGRQLSLSQKNILFCRQNRQSSYITPEDLCSFLHISKHNLKRNNAINPLEQGLIDQFYSLLGKQEQLEQELIAVLSQVNLQGWFGEVDFFNNGYIDTSALYEYFLHYDGHQHVFEEYNALIILKIIKRHTLSDKLVLEDFKNFLEKTREIQIFLTNEQLSPVQSIKATEHHLDQHIKQKSNELYSLESEVSIAPQIRIGPKLVDALNYNNHFQSLNLISREQIEEQLKQEENITYQQRLIRLHARNEKYIKKAKRQMEGIIPICNVQIQSHMQVQTFKAGSAQLIRQIRLLGDIYNKIVRLIRQFLTKNTKFTFLNAYSMLDDSEENDVDITRWNEYAKEHDINVSAKKLAVFFNCYSRKGNMDYSQYLKIYKYSSLQEDFIRCSTRYPLIYENWTEELKETYRQFLIRIIRLVEQRQTIVTNIQRQDKQLQILVKSFSFNEEIIQILGQQYRNFVREYFQQQKEQLSCRILGIKL